MIVVVQAVLSVVADEDVGPAIVVVVANGHAESPAVVGDAGLFGNIGESAVVVVMEERCVGRRGFAVDGVEGGPVDKIDIEPAVVVVIDQTHAGTVGFDDEFLLGRAHGVAPRPEPRLLRDVLEDHRAGIGKAARGDGTVLGIVNRSMHAGSRVSSPTDWAVGGGAWQKAGRGSASAKRLTRNKRPIYKRRTPKRVYAVRIAERIILHLAHESDFLVACKDLDRNRFHIG